VWPSASIPSIAKGTYQVLFPQLPRHSSAPPPLSPRQSCLKPVDSWPVSATSQGVIAAQSGVGKRLSLIEEPPQYGKYSLCLLAQAPPFLLDKAIRKPSFSHVIRLRLPPPGLSRLDPPRTRLMRLLSRGLLLVVTGVAAQDPPAETAPVVGSDPLPFDPLALPEMPEGMPLPEGSPLPMMRTFTVDEEDEDNEEPPPPVYDPPQCEGDLVLYKEVRSKGIMTVSTI
jgi:hypothetical protein